MKFRAELGGMYSLKYPIICRMEVDVIVLNKMSDDTERQVLCVLFLYVNVKKKVNGFISSD